MKERPIIFSAPMVRAILSGAKTQTRRVVKPQPDYRYGVLFPQGSSTGYSPDLLVGACPYGRPGDRLWVREAWRLGAWLHRDPGGRLPNAVAIDYQADNFARREWLPCVDHELFRRLVKQSIADAQRAGIKPNSADEYNWKAGNGPTRWRPSIHMPRWASRITLEITDVRVERLQDISEEDAIAEGALEWARDVCAAGNPTGFTAVGYFWLLWEPINGPESWSANPWVWVIEFKRLEQA